VPAYMIVDITIKDAKPIFPVRRGSPAHRVSLRRALPCPRRRPSPRLATGTGTSRGFPSPTVLVGNQEN